MHHGGDVRAPQHDNVTTPSYLLLSCMVALSLESATSEEWTIDRYAYAYHVRARADGMRESLYTDLTAPHESLSLSLCCFAVRGESVCFLPGSMRCSVDLVSLVSVNPTTVGVQR